MSGSLISGLNFYIDSSLCNSYLSNGFSSKSVRFVINPSILESFFFMLYDYFVYLVDVYPLIIFREVFGVITFLASFSKTSILLSFSADESLKVYYLATIVMSYDGASYLF
jgi:hypothetical protein